MAINPNLLEKLIANDPSVEELNLSKDIESEEDIAVLAVALRNNTHLKKLTIHGIPGGPSRVTDESAKSLSQCHGLSSLDISFNGELTNEGIAYFAETPLRVLQAAGCWRLTGAAFFPFFEHKTLVQFGLWNLTLKLSFKDETKIGLMLKRNDSLKKVTDFIALFLKRCPTVIDSLPPFAQETMQKLAEKCSQDKLGGEIDIRTLMNNLLKTPEGRGAGELKDADKLVKEYLEEKEKDERQLKAPYFSLGKREKKKAKTTSSEEQPEEEQSEAQFEDSGSPSI